MSGDAREARGPGGELAEANRRIQASAARVQATALATLPLALVPCRCATRPRWGARLRRPRPAAHTQLCQAREHLEVACRMVGVASQALVEQPTPAGVDVMVDLVRQFNEACLEYQAAAARPGRR